MAALSVSTSNVKTFTNPAQAMEKENALLRKSLVTSETRASKAEGEFEESNLKVQALHIQITAEKAALAEAHTTAATAKATAQVRSNNAWLRRTFPGSSTLHLNLQSSMLHFCRHIMKKKGAPGVAGSPML